MEKEQKIAKEGTRKSVIFGLATVSLVIVSCLFLSLHDNVSGVVLLPDPEDRETNPEYGQLRRRVVPVEANVAKIPPPPPPQQQQQQPQQTIATAGRRDPAILRKLEKDYAALDAQVRKIKKTGIIMETDAKSLAVTGQLQDVCRRLLQVKYGPDEPYRVRFDLTFPSSIVVDREFFVVELAPARLVPYSVYNFLEVARTAHHAGFHRKAGHVLQAFVNGTPIKSLAFQEYSREYPHKKGTMGYCGRPSGPCFYVSIQDNTSNHGPGSQQKRNPNEADANFGTIVEGFEDVVLGGIKKMEFREFTSDKSKMVMIKKMTILVSDGNGGFKEWQDPTTPHDMTSIL